jgi:uncharacterized membrane protein
MENAMMERRQRPTGVTIMAVLLGIEGLLELIGGILLIVLANSISRTIISHGHKFSAHVVDGLGIGIGSVGIVIGAVTLLFVFGLWTLRRWAYWAVIIIEGLSLLWSVLGLVRHSDTAGSTFGGTIASMIIPVVVLVYFLFFPNVRRAFRI